MSYEIFMYAGWPCAIAAGVVAAANFHALRVEQARSHNLHKRVQVCVQGLLKIRNRVTATSVDRPCERDMARFASEALAAQYETAIEGDA